MLNKNARIYRICSIKYDSFFNVDKKPSFGLNQKEAERRIQRKDKRLEAIKNMTPVITEAMLSGKGKMYLFFYITFRGQVHLGVVLYMFFIFGVSPEPLILTCIPYVSTDKPVVFY